MIPSATSLSSLMSIKVSTKGKWTKNYQMKRDKLEIKGCHEGLSAMEQVIYKILNTERYQYLIYSWNYGIELLDLYGEPASYVCAELPRRIREALCQDDRIHSVGEFTFDTTERGIIFTTFSVQTEFGDMTTDLEVSY